MRQFFNCKEFYVVRITASKNFKKDDAIRFTLYAESALQTFVIRYIDSGSNFVEDFFSQGLKMWVMSQFDNRNITFIWNLNNFIRNFKFIQKYHLAISKKKKKCWWSVNPFVTMFLMEVFEGIVQSKILFPFP